MIEITRHTEPGRGDALVIQGEAIAWLPDDFGRLTPPQIVAAYEAWEDGEGEPLTQEAFVACLVRKGLLTIH